MTSVKINTIPQAQNVKFCFDKKFVNIQHFEIQELFRYI